MNCGRHGARCSAGLSVQHAVHPRLAADSGSVQVPRGLASKTSSTPQPRLALASSLPERGPWKALVINPQKASVLLRWRAQE